MRGKCNLRTITDTLVPPTFAINGTASGQQQNYVLAMVDLGNTSFQLPQAAHYLGANFTANGSVGGLTTLSNSTPAYIEYWAASPVDGLDPHR